MILPETLDRRLQFSGSLDGTLLVFKRLRKAMRFVLITLVLIASQMAPAGAQALNEFVTMQNAILCLDPVNLRTANERAIARSSIVLKAMGCIRIEAGIPARLLERAEFDGTWRVRLYPEGISNGVMLWGLSSSFTTSEVSKLHSDKRAGS